MPTPDEHLNEGGTLNPQTPQPAVPPDPTESSGSAESAVPSSANEPNASAGPFDSVDPAESLDAHLHDTEPEGTVPVEDG
ncbi:MAG TPA: hypothetical protein VGJ86_20920, partial [Acidimicrobiales bacterium]